MSSNSISDETRKELITLPSDPRPLFQETGPGRRRLALCGALKQMPDLPSGRPSQAKVACNRVANHAELDAELGLSGPLHRKTDPRTFEVLYVWGEDECRSA